MQPLGTRLITWYKSDLTRSRLRLRPPARSGNEIRENLDFTPAGIRVAFDIVERNNDKMGRYCFSALTGVAH